MGREIFKEYPVAYPGKKDGFYWWNSDVAANCGYFTYTPPVTALVEYRCAKTRWRRTTKVELKRQPEHRVYEAMHAVFKAGIEGTRVRVLEVL